MPEIVENELLIKGTIKNKVGGGLKCLCTNVCLCVTLGEKRVTRRRRQHRFTPAAADTLTQAPLDVNCLEDWQEGNVDRSDETSHCGVT